MIYTMAINGNGNGERQKWGLLKEKILMYAGLALIFLDAIGSIVFSKPFIYEVALAGLCLCGVSITQWGDRK